MGPFLFRFFKVFFLSFKYDRWKHKSIHHELLWFTFNFVDPHPIWGPADLPSKVVMIRFI